MNIFAFFWTNILIAPILNLLILFYHLLFDNLGLSIIAVTIFIRIITYPLTKPSLEAQKKQKELMPEIEKMKKKYKNKQTMAKKQMELYKKHGINPAAGCVSQIIPLIIILALYRVFNNILVANGEVIEEVNKVLYDWDYLQFVQGASINTEFLYLNLAKADPFFILPILAAATQFIMSKYMMKNTKSMEKTVEKTPDKKDDIMYNMQGQMAYMFPIMTLVIGVRLPSGLVLYWFISTVLALGQYYLINRDKVKVNNN